MLLSLPVTLEAICETSDHETDRGDCWKQNCWRRGCWRRDTGGEAARSTATLTMRLMTPAMSWPTVPRVSMAQLPPRPAAQNSWKAGAPQTYVLMTTN